MDAKEDGMIELDPTTVIERGQPDSLSYAEKWQLATDYLTNPAAFGHVRDFSQQQLGEILDLQGLFADHTTAASKLNKQEADYDALIFATQPGTRDDATKATIKAVGEAWGESKDSHRDLTEHLYKGASAFSALFAQHCIAQLDGAPLLIAGKPYTYETGYLETADPVSHKPIIFAPLTEVKRRNATEIMNIPHIQRRIETTYVKMALTTQWNMLLGGLELISRS